MFHRFSNQDHLLLYRWLKFFFIRVLRWFFGPIYVNLESQHNTTNTTDDSSKQCTPEKILEGKHFLLFSLFLRRAQVVHPRGKWLYRVWITYLYRAYALTWPIFYIVMVSDLIRVSSVTTIFRADFTVLVLNLNLFKGNSKLDMYL